MILNNFYHFVLILMLIAACQCVGYLIGRKFSSLLLTYYKKEKLKNIPNTHKKQILDNEDILDQKNLTLFKIFNKNGSKENE